MGIFQMAAEDELHAEKVDQMEIIEPMQVYAYK